MHVHGHEHVCQVVRDQGELHAALARFLEGLEGKAGRDGIFVHRYDEAEAWALLEAAGPARRLRDAGHLQAIGREPAFQGGAPRIHHDHVGQTVAGALESARKRGRGLSIIADASHAYIVEGRYQEWIQFENWLGRRLAHEVALVCLYWQQDLENPAVLDGMLRTHMAQLESRPRA